MSLSIFSSDSDSSDLEVLALLSDWDTDSDTEGEPDNESNCDIDMDFDPGGGTSSDGDISVKIKSESRANEMESRADERESRANERESRADERESRADERESSASESNSKANKSENLANNSSHDHSSVNGADHSSQKLRRVNYLLSLEDADFTFRFRLSKTAVESLLTEIMPNVRVTSSRNHGVSPLHQVLVTLRFYALGCMLAPVAEYVGVSKSTVCRIIRDISIAIAKLDDIHIYCHLQSAENFFAIAGFPQVLGIIDCTHIRIQSQRNDLGNEFRNRGGYLSLNVQAVCDAELKFMNVDASWAGSTEDANIFDNSVLKALCDAGKFGDRWFLGDSAYPKRAYMLTPILNPTTEPEKKYNEAHARTRSIIKRTFEAWKRRFPIVGSTLRLSLAVSHAVIIATAILHNISRNHNLPDIPPEVELQTEEPEDFILEHSDEDNLETQNDVLNNYFAK